MTFAKPPLVELMAEVRWGIPTIPLGQSGGTSAFPIPIVPGQPVQFTASGAYDSFFAEFAKRVRELGFTIQERTVPANMVVPPFKAVWRWQNPDAPGTMLQLGAGVFTINGAPPTYIKWADFVGTVSSALDALLGAMPTYPEPPEKFSQLLMRYVDLFDEHLAEGKKHAEFLRDVLGVNVVLPKAMTEQARPESDIAPSLSVAMPVEGGSANFVFTPGIVSGKSGFILDSTITADRELSIDRDVVVENFTRAHDILNSIFVGMTAPIHRLMEPTT
uniref:TIGR04255 family protein n=1 Tax=Burkholderia anthina TaxID=179879 RepID=UPI001589010E|nr:TIGR04255 family protein [Burkholderia anthina]